MSEEPFDPARVLETLDRHGVDYIVVGGIGGRLHGASRRTDDFDAVMRWTPANLQRVADALGELGVRIRAEGLDDEVARTLPAPNAATLEPMELSTWRTDAGDVDVLRNLPTLDGGRADFEQLDRNAVIVDLDDASVRVASLDDIIDSKAWSNRPKDREALPELRELSDHEHRDATSEASADDGHSPDLGNGHEQ